MMTGMSVFLMVLPFIHFSADKYIFKFLKTLKGFQEEIVASMGLAGFEPAATRL
jgi:hypothetical protein